MTHNDDFLTLRNVSPSCSGVGRGLNLERDQDTKLKIKSGKQNLRYFLPFQIINGSVTVELDLITLGFESICELRLEIGPKSKNACSSCP